MTEEDREREYTDAWERSDAGRDPDSWDPQPPPDPADYCRQCGRPLTSCRAWNEGDHTGADLL